MKRHETCALSNSRAKLNWTGNVLNNIVERDQVEGFIVLKKIHLLQRDAVSTQSAEFLLWDNVVAHGALKRKLAAHQCIANVGEDFAVAATDVSIAGNACNVRSFLQNSHHLVGLPTIVAEFDVVSPGFV